MKALYRDADILILDEPTAVLTPGEVDEFFGVVRSLVDQGKSIVFITHKLREVLAVADRITVLRHGRVVGTADPKEATPQSLATLMVGRDVILAIDKEPAQPGAARLQVRDLTVHDDRGLVTTSAISTSTYARVRSSGSRASRATASASSSKRSPACANPTAGSIEVDGVDLTARDATRRSPSTASPTSPKTATSTASSARSPSPTTWC